MRLPCMSQRDSIDPVDEAYKVHGGGRGDMLQVHLGVTEVTRSPQIKGSYALRYGGLDSRPHGIKADKLGRLLTSPCCLQGDVFVSCPESHDAPLRGWS